MGRIVRRFSTLTLALAAAAFCLGCGSSQQQSLQQPTGTSVPDPSASAPPPIAPATPPATPSSAAQVYDRLEEMSGWGSCGTTSCAGGAQDATSWPMYQFQTTPALDGASTEFVITGLPYSNALHWYKGMGAQNWATNYLWDFWTYVDDASLTAQTLEFDLFTVVPISGQNRKFMFGSQCNYAKGYWEGWQEGSGGNWVATSIPCTKFAPNTWHHVIWYLQRVGTNLDQIQYVNLTVDDVTYELNMLQQSQPTTWNPVLGVQFQQDIGKSGTSFHQWIDKVKVTIW